MGRYISIHGNYLQLSISFYLSTGSHPATGHKYTMEDLRRMEADLKRKSDLLSEVKILLGQAAERERSLIAEREEAKAKVN